MRQHRLKTYLGRIAVLVVLLAAWEILGRLKILDPFFFSKPSDIGATLLDWARTGYLAQHTWITFEETIVGFILGAALGLVVGIVMGLNALMASIFDPYVNAAYSLPKVALGPLFILWFGIDIKMKIVLAAVLAFFLVFYNTYNGVKAVERDLIDTLLVMGAKRSHVLFKVILPSAVTWVFNGLRVSVPQALIGAVIGEIIASNRGLGYVLQYSAGQYDTTGTMAALVALTLMAVILDAILALIESRFTRWRGVM